MAVQDVELRSPGANPQDINFTSASGPTYIASLTEAVSLSETLSTLRRNTVPLAETVALSELFAARTPKDTVRFNASADRLDMATGAWPTSNTWSLCFWGKIIVDTNNETHFVSLDTAFSSSRHSIKTDVTGTQLYWEDTGIGRVNIGSMVVGKWYFICATSNAGVATAAAMGDETTAVGALTTGSAATAITYGSGYIGSDGNGLGLFLNGSMGMLRIWDGVVLTLAEFQAEQFSHTVIRTSNLLDVYQLNSPATVLNDTSGNSHTLTNLGSGSWTEEIGPVFVEAYNQALRINAAQDTLQLTTLSNISNVTMLGWFRIVNARGFSTVFSFENTGLGQFNEVGFEGTGLGLSTIDGGGYTTHVTLTAGVWYKVAWILTSGSYTVYFGTEGSALTTYTGTRVNLTGSPDLQQIGGTSAAAEWLDGRFSGVRVWNAVLTSGECATEFTSASPVRTADLLGAWLPPSVTVGTVYTAISGTNLAQGSTAGSPVYTLEAGPLLDSSGGPTAYTGSVAETVSLAEAILVHFNAKTTAAETVSLTESTSALLGAIQALSETLTFSESLAAVRRTIQALSETVTISEALAAIRHMANTVVETVVVSEAAVAVKHVFITAAETVTVSESLASQFVGHSTLSETVTLSEALVGRIRFISALSETVSVSETDAAHRASTTSLTETATLSELLTARLHVLQSLAETISISESLLAKYNAKAAVTETVTLSEALASRFTGHASLVETVTLAESLVGALSFRATISETVTVSEVLASRLNAKPALAETLTLSESLASLAILHATLTETVTLSESLTSQAGFHTTAAETVSLSETLATLGHFHSTVTEAVTLTESLVALKRAAAALADAVAVAESLAAKAAFHAAQAETVGFSEALAGTELDHISLTESVTLSESLATRGVFRSTLADTVTLSESLSTLRKAIVALTETDTLSETLTAVAKLKNALSESMTLSESLASKAQFRATLAETDTFSESISVGGSTNYSSFVAETVTLSESVAAKFRAHATAAETVALSDTTAALKKALATLVETVTSSEAVSATYTPRPPLHETVTLLETVSLAESLVSHWVSRALLSETIVLSESMATKARFLQQMQPQNWTLTEDVSSLRVYLESLTESVVVSDSLSSLAHFIQPLGETLPIVDIISLAEPGHSEEALAEVVLLDESLSARLRTHGVVGETVRFAEEMRELETLSFRQPMLYPQVIVAQKTQAQKAADDLAAAKAAAQKKLNTLKGR